MAVRKEYIAAVACIAVAVTADMFIALARGEDARPATALCAALIMLNFALVVFWSGRKMVPVRVAERPKSNHGL